MKITSRENDPELRNFVGRIIKEYKVGDAVKMPVTKFEELKEASTKAAQNGQKVTLIFGLRNPIEIL